MRYAVTVPIITIDVEDWPQSTWDRDLPIRPRAADNTRRLLDLLDEENVRATLFVLGKFAERFPTVVSEIARRGHEVASHGHGHVETFCQGPERFSKDVQRSKDFLEDILGAPVFGYRAPDFSIVKSSIWALDVLAELGFAYDSSIFPVRHSRYGFPSWPDAPVRARLAGGGRIVEFPIATYEFLGRNWPVGGGGYHRLLPGGVSRHLARRVLAERPFVFYCHPYEFDPADFSQIDLPIPRRIRLHQGLGRRWFEGRFRAFLREFGGCRAVDALHQQRWPDFAPISAE